MNVVVFGSGTSLGREVVTDLVFRGHSVTAVAGDFAQVPEQWADRVELRAGDPADGQLVDAAVAGNEVVLDVLGDCRGGRAVEHSVAVTRQIVESMDRHGRSRYIGLRPDVLLRAPGRRASWAGLVGLPGPGGRSRTRRAVVDAFEAVVCSPLSWTIVRCPGLTDGPSRGIRHVGMTRRDAVGPSVTRTDAARFLAAQVLETSYVCAAPAISN